MGEPSGWHSVLTSGAFRARIVRTFTAELMPGLETTTLISVPTLSFLRVTGVSRDVVDESKGDGMGKRERQRDRTEEHRDRLGPRRHGL